MRRSTEFLLRIFLVWRLLPLLLMVFLGLGAGITFAVVHFLVYTGAIHVHP